MCEWLVTIPNFPKHVRGWPQHHLRHVLQTLHRVWFVEYDWPPFLIPLGMSIVGILMGSALEHLVRAIMKRPLDPCDPLAVSMPSRSSDQGNFPVMHLVRSFVKQPLDPLTPRR